MIKTAIIILNYNGKSYLEKFIPSVIRYSKDAEIIIADNNSSDDSIDFLSSKFPNIKLIIFQENYGFAAGYNEALRKIEAKYFLFLNSDVEVTENWLYPMVSFLDMNETYAACQPKIKDYNHKTLFEYAGACGGFLDFLGYPFCRGRIFNHLEIDSGQYDNPIDIFWSSGACMLIRSSVFSKAGRFDPAFFAHMEEIDLCWRIQSLGFKIRSLPESTVYHVGGGTLQKSNPFKTYLNFRNGLFLLLKNLPRRKLWLKFPLRILLDWVAALKFLIEINPTHSLSVIKAHISVIANFKKMIVKRNLMSSIPKSKLTPFEYYLKKNRKFSDL